MTSNAVESSASASFDRWFANYLQQSELQVETLLGDKMAIRFVIAWSLFETACFKGFATVPKFPSVVETIINNNASIKQRLKEPAEHFHRRYQDKNHYRHLMHGKQSTELEQILAKPLSDLAEAEVIFMLLFIVHRFRNNIFHGNKGVLSWREYKSEITHCLVVMQTLISTCKEMGNGE